MDFMELSSNMGYEFEFRNTVQPGFNGIIIPNAALHALHGPFGDFVMQDIMRPKYDLWYNNYLSRQRFKTHAEADIPIIELCILLEKAATFTVDDEIGKIRLRQFQFNIIFTPVMDSHVQFEKSAFYTSLDIHAKSGLLADINARFPKLMEPLMNAIIANRAYMYFDKPMDLTPEMMNLVDFILIVLSKPNINTYLLDIAVVALFAHAIAYKDEVTSNGISYRKKEEHKEQLYKLMEVLQSDKIFKGISYYAKDVGMSETGLMNYFKNLFGFSIKQFWRDLNLQKACDEVKNTNKTFDEIAFIYGYADAASFSKAFKKKYGHPPSYFRFGNNLKD